MKATSQKGVVTSAEFADTCESATKADETPKGLLAEEAAGIRQSGGLCC